MKTACSLLFATAVFSAALVGCNDKSKEKEAAKPVEPLRAEESVEVTVTARVKAINQATREVTLADTSGQEISFIAGDQVKRLNEVRVGDNVTARYRVTLVGELRPPTADEVAHPITVVASAGRSPQGAQPAGGAGTEVRVVTTVQAIDLANMLVTLQGPMGDRVTFRARNPENVKKLRVGDTIVLTYTEAMAIMLEKAGS